MELLSRALNGLCFQFDFFISDFSGLFLLSIVTIKLQPVYLRWKATLPLNCRFEHSL